MKYRIAWILGLLVIAQAPATEPIRVVWVEGELKQWHKVTVGLIGAQADETDEVNPFTDYRMTVTFTHGSGSPSYRVPGYFAADGNAAETSATGGFIWRAHLSPDKPGRWKYRVSFVKGKHVAITDAKGEPVKHCDGQSGTFQIQPFTRPCDPRDFRGKGRLQYVGGHYLKFAGNGAYFLKQGPDAPENLLAYEDFDNTPNHGNRRKAYRPHVRDWQPGDPTWKYGKGKGLIGAINYLASEGLNSISFIPMNIGGDDKNVFPYLSDKPEDRLRIDVSKTAQWEIVLEHAQRKGMFLHFKTLENENELLFDGGEGLGPERRLYYRELIARFGHHLALNWNLGEEIVKATTEQKKSWAQYFHDHDPYHHHIVIHNMNVPHYDLLGPGSKLTGFSLQTHRPNFETVHRRVLDYLERSQRAGKPWAVACDEPGDHRRSVRPDNDAGRSHEDARRYALWGTLLAGGWGNEWYFGYEHAHCDLTLQDFRSRDRWWDYCRFALQFFKDNDIPFWEMISANARVDNANNDNNRYCFAKPGEVYVVCLPRGGTCELDLTDVVGGAAYKVRWYNPRRGGKLLNGTVRQVRDGDKAKLGNPPDEHDKDWVVLVRR